MQGHQGAASKLFNGFDFPEFNGNILVFTLTIKFIRIYTFLVVHWIYPLNWPDRVLTVPYKGWPNFLLIAEEPAEIQWYGFYPI